MEALIRRYKDRALLPLSFLFPGMTLDFGNHTVSIEDKPLSLKKREFQIFSLLIKKQSQVLSLQEIYESVWVKGGQYTAKKQFLVVDNVNSLRRKIAPWGFDEKIRTVRGHGYKLSAEFHDHH